MIGVDESERLLSTIERASTNQGDFIATDFRRCRLLSRCRSTLRHMVSLGYPPSFTSAYEKPCIYLGRPSHEYCHATDTLL